MYFCTQYTQAKKRFEKLSELKIIGDKIKKDLVYNDEVDFKKVKQFITGNSYLPEIEWILDSCDRLNSNGYLIDCV